MLFERVVLLVHHRIAPLLIEAERGAASSCSVDIVGVMKARFDGFSVVYSAAVVTRSGHCDVEAQEKC